MLEEWLTKQIRIHAENGPMIIVKPLKEVRKLRQSPAHRFIDDKFSLECQKNKEVLVVDVYFAVSNIRRFFQTHPHPKARGYAFPEHLKLGNLVVF